MSIKKLGQNAQIPTTQAPQVAETQTAQQSREVTASQIGLSQFESGEFVIGSQTQLPSSAQVEGGGSSVLGLQMRLGENNILDLMQDVAKELNVFQGAGNWLLDRIRGGGDASQTPNINPDDIGVITPLYGTPVVEPGGELPIDVNPIDFEPIDLLPMYGTPRIDIPGPVDPIDVGPIDVTPIEDPVDVGPAPDFPDVIMPMYGTPVVDGPVEEPIDLNPIDIMPMPMYGTPIVDPVDVGPIDGEPAPDFPDMPVLLPMYGTPTIRRE